MNKYKLCDWVYTYSENGLIFKHQIQYAFDREYKITGKPGLQKEETLFKLKREALAAMKAAGIEKSTLKKEFMKQHGGLTAKDFLKDD